MQVFSICRVIVNLKTEAASTFEMSAMMHTSTQVMNYREHLKAAKLCFLK
jgi:hypothetical protein